jgi:helix-turn-helix protein
MESQCFIAETPTEPPPKQRVAAPVASRGGDDKQKTTVHTKPYNPISLLDKWRLLQAIITDPRLSPTAKVVAGALLDCLNCQTGRCYPSLAHLAKRVGKKRGVISAAICRLIECGWLFRRRRRGASSYRFAFGRLQEDVQKNGLHEADMQEAALPGVQNAGHEDIQEVAI